MLYYYTKGNKILYYFGICLSILCGLLYPIFSIFLADTLLEIFQFSNYPTEKSFIRQQVDQPILAIVFIGVSAFVLNLLEVFIFSVIA